MDFEDSQDEAKFRAEVRSWLDQNAKGSTADGDEMADRSDKDFLARARAWQAKKAKAGYARITWPKEVGGFGGTPIQQVIFSQEESMSNVSGLGGPFGIGLGMCIPTLMAYGSKDSIGRYVKPALFGEEIWCQLFSEPAGGSDVAGLRTRAEKKGDEWIINGQKIWTSGAHYSDYGLLITRTDPNVPKHKGLTMFFLSMKSPGVEVRPIKQANGMQEFNE